MIRPVANLRMQRASEADEARARAVAAISACAMVPPDANDDGKSRRTFDPTWKAMEVSVVEYARALRVSGCDAEATISAVRQALEEAAPHLPPHNAIRSAVVGWSVRAFFESRSLLTDADSPG
jgi:hypothetical protein